MTKDCDVAKSQQKIDNIIKPFENLKNFTNLSIKTNKKEAKVNFVNLECFEKKLNGNLNLFRENFNKILPSHFFKVKSPQGNLQNPNLEKMINCFRNAFSKLTYSGDLKQIFYKKLQNLKYTSKKVFRENKYSKLYQEILSDY
ncbi:hypothetical protein BpHYR1_015829 [Brachionus plicatilis]|uniref:Uncharacterized protein n=1 Tax=Brachionus plicatilis TaxID=10195 RepID=A0A3M7SP27_BRAPC|nr:hypothetical protein BpHYR1_015829 [Brachionus plicatilis]